MESALRLHRENLAWAAGYLALLCVPLAAMLSGRLTHAGRFLEEFAIALGYAGAAMVAGQFILTARLRWLTPPIGIDGIFGLHRDLGMVGLALLAGHGVLLAAIGPGIRIVLDPWRAPLAMTAGVWSLTGLAILVATSVYRRRLALEYDRWRYLHAALATIAMALALSHVARAGHTTTVAARTFAAVALGALAFLPLGWVRVVRPLLLRRRPYRVVSVAPDHGDAWTIVVEPAGHRGIRFRAGQFVWLTLGASPCAMREHPFSISSAPASDGRLEFTIKELGDFTRTIGHVRPGETAWIDGPYGAFTLDPGTPGFVLIGGGIGLAPLMSQLAELAARGDRRPVLLIVACSAYDRIPFRERIVALQAQLALDVVTVLETPPPGWAGETGRIDRALLTRHLPGDRARRAYHVCGPTPMIDAIEDALHALGVPRRHVHAERFDLV